MGIKINKDDLRFVHASHIKIDEVEFLKFCFTTEKWIGEPSNKELAKHEHGSWFKIDNLPKNIHSMDLEVINAYLKGIYYTESAW